MAARIASSEMSSAASSTSASAASRCAASIAAAIASGLGLGRRISECSRRYSSSVSPLRSGAFAGRLEDFSFLSLFTNRTHSTAEEILAQVRSLCYWLENSTFPSISVGIPSQVAGRYLQLRTTESTSRSPDRPALSKINGLCTRPSVPIIKLTFTRCPYAGITSRGVGVVKACGSCTSWHTARALT